MQHEMGERPEVWAVFAHPESAAAYVENNWGADEPEIRIIQREVLP
jgi:hypothetical protein